MTESYRSGRASFADTADIDLFVAYLEKHSPVAPPQQNRMVRKP